MSFQVRHNKMGIFQGEFLGMGFWHPMSQQPEQGLCEFPTKIAACAFIAHMITEAHGDGNFIAIDFAIEPFDVKLDFEMQLAKIEET